MKMNMLIVVRLEILNYFENVGSEFEMPSVVIIMSDF